MRTVLWICTFSLVAACSGQEGKGQSQGSSNVQRDVWLGPGFYYGTWFDHEEDYYSWRNDHRDYPPNRPYFDRNERIYYHPEDRDRGDGRRGDGARGGGGGGHHGR